MVVQASMEAVGAVKSSMALKFVTGHYNVDG
jgi:hypothetical protein